jgi:Flp pilus assembly protein TadD
MPFGRYIAFVGSLLVAILFLADWYLPMAPTQSVTIAKALKVYADRVERMVCLGGQGNYEYACKLIERMRRLRQAVGETKQHLAYLYDLMNRHKARRNFMKLFDRT